MCCIHILQDAFGAVSAQSHFLDAYVCGLSKLSVLLSVMFVFECVSEPKMGYQITEKFPRAVVLVIGFSFSSVRNCPRSKLQLI